MSDPHGRFKWYELMTTDMAAAKAFYAQVVGWGVHDVPMPGIDYALFIAGKTTVAGVMELPEDARDTGVAPGWMGYVGVDDVDASAERVEQLGGAVHVPPQDVPDVSRFSIVADPQAAMFALFKGLQPEQIQPAEPSKLGRVSWHELLAADGDTAFAFYAELFGWRKTDSTIVPTGTYQVFSTGGGMTGGVFTKPPTVPAPFWLYYFYVGDIDAAASRVKTAGGHILDGPLDVPGGTWVVRCTDPQGAMFALQGTRKRTAVGYFERDAARDPSDTLGRRWNW